MIIQVQTSATIMHNHGTACRRLCQELAKTGPLESQVLYRQQLEELEPLIRFCQYEQSRAGSSQQATQEQLPEQLQVSALLVRQGCWLARCIRQRCWIQHQVLCLVQREYYNAQS